MKRYLVLILVVILVLTSGLLAGCTQETQPDTDLQEFRNRLVESYQKKLMQLEQVEGELAELQAEMDEVEVEFEHLKKLTSGIKAVHNLTREELEAGFAIEGVSNKLTQLHEQEQALLATKQSLQEDIEELEQVLRQD